MTDCKILTGGELARVLDLIDTTTGQLEVKLARSELSYEDLFAAAGCSLDTHPGKSNWVEKGGGLPEYICEVARSIHVKRGMPIQAAIPIAVGVIKRWARGGGDVNADTRTKAAAAVAQWEKMKMATHAKSAAKAAT